MSLASFACGGNSKYEQEVDSIVAEIAAGRAPFLHVRVAEDPENGALIGLCATQGRAFGDQPSEPDAAYIGVIGINGPFRGWRTYDGTRFGDVLLTDALTQVRYRWGDGPMPRVWALVDPPNTASHNLFDRHEFGKLAASGAGYDIWFLSRGEPTLF